jgi:hypothetical protein
VLGRQRISCVGEVLERDQVWWSRLYRRRTGCKIRNAGGFSWFLNERDQEVGRWWVKQLVEHDRLKRERYDGPLPF